MKLKDACVLEEKTNLSSILKNRDITLPTKVCIVKAVVFPVVMYGCECMCVNFSHVRVFVTPWTIAHKAPLSMEFSKQEYWSELPFPSPEDLPNPGIKPISPALTGRFFTDVKVGP